MKKIYIVRHGETDYNKRGIVQGSGIDAPLNEIGRKQAQAFFAAYGEEPFDKVYTSALQRTWQSVEGFINQKGLEHEKLAGLNEINWGDKEGQPFTQDENIYYREMITRWENGETDYPVQGGESPEQVAERQREAIQHIMAQSKEEKVLVAMHGRAMRILLCQLLRYPLRSMDLFLHQNMGLYVLSFTGKLFVVDRYNDTRHLKW